MRTLQFIVKGQEIYPNKQKDISGLVAGTSGYLRAKFSFSQDWNDCVKVCGFSSKSGIEFEPKQLDADNSCIIPKEALEYHEFEIRLYGKNKKYTITTRPIKIKQYGGVK